MKKSFVSHNPDETFSLARRLAENLPRGTVIYLTGDLGAGKTAFTRGFVSYWEMENQVTSPTFSIMNEYRSPEQTIAHYDLYRLSCPGELAELGMEETVDRADFTLIEWPQYYLDEYGLPGLTIEFHFGESENERRIELEGDNRILGKIDV